MQQPDLIQRKLGRERAARKEAEALLEAKSRELFETNERLRRLNETLEERVQERTTKLAEVNENLLEEIDERERIASRLRLTQFAVDRAVDAIFWTDDQGRFVYANEAASKHSGYTNEELLQLAVFDLDKHMQAEMWEGHWQQLRDQEQFKIDSHHIRRDGSEIPVEITVNLLRFGEQELNCVHVRDTSERKLHEFQLQFANSQLETLIDRLQSAVMLENEHGEVSLANTTFCKLFHLHCEVEQIEGSRSSDIVEELATHIEQPRDYVEQHAKIRDRNTTLVGEELRLKDGRVLELDHVPMSVADKYKGHVWFYRDVTESRETYEVLERMVIATSGKVGEEFFDALTEQLALSLGVDSVYAIEYTFKGELLVLSTWPRIENHGRSEEGLEPEMLLEIKTDLERAIADANPFASSRYRMSVALQDEQMNPIGILYIADALPINKRRLAETMLTIFAQRSSAEIMLRRDQEEIRKLAMVAARTDNAVVITDSVGRVEWVNEGFVRITGFSLSDVLGRTPGSILQGEDTDPETVAYMRKQLREGRGFQCELVNYRKNGAAYWLSIEIQPIHDQNGILTHYIAVETDISERKRADELLKLQGEVLEQIAIGVPVSEVLKYLCDRVERIVPNTQCAILQNSISETGRSEDNLSEEAHEAILALRSNREASSVTSDGSIDDANQFGTGPCWQHPIKIKNEVIGTFAVYATKMLAPETHERSLFVSAATLSGIALQRERTEETLRRARKQAEAASDAKSEFLANMSHEIRTPITAITGYADLLSAPAGRSARDVKWASQIVSSVGHLRELLDDILDLSKVEAGRLAIQHVDIPILRLVQDVVEQFQSRVQEKLLDFELRIEDGVPARLVTDRTRLRQVLTNLLSNAIKFTPAGKVELILSCLDSSGANGADEISFELRDSGIGIAESELDEIFDPFRRLEHGAAAAGGTGLGLAISHRLASLMDGRLEVESEPGVGSSFKLVLPLVRPNSSGLEKPEVEAVPFDQEQPLQVGIAGLSVLLVEDNLDNEQIFIHMLEPTGANLSIARNGREGVEAVAARLEQGSHFDLILMDMQMPIMDGFAATKMIRSMGINTPIIALTAFAMQSDEEKCRKAGCDGFLPKPVVRRELFERISSTMGSTKMAKGSNQDSTDHSPSSTSQSNSVGDDFSPLIRNYQQSLVAYLGQLEGMTEKHLDELQQLTHRIAGTAANYGFHSVGQHARDCNERLRHGADWLELADQIAELKTAIVATLDQKY